MQRVPFMLTAKKTKIRESTPRNRLRDYRSKPNNHATSEPHTHVMSNENKFPLETLSLRAKLYESKGLTLVINTVRVRQNVQTNKPQHDSRCVRITLQQQPVQVAVTALPIERIQRTLTPSAVTEASTEPKQQPQYCRWVVHVSKLAREQPGARRTRTSPRSNSASMRRQNVSKAKSPPSNAVRRRR